MFDGMTPARWREDLDWLAAAIVREHVRPSHTISPDRFHAVIGAIRRRLPAMAAHEVPVTFARLLAAVGDGHTGLSLGAVSGYGRFPISVGLYDDGVFIRAATADQAALLGTRLLAVDGIPIASVLEAIRPVVSHDNGLGALARMPELLVIPEVLHAVGVIATPQVADWTVARPDGRSESVRLDRVSARPDDLLGVRPVPDDPEPSGNRFRLLPGEPRTIHLHYDVVRDGVEETLAGLFARLMDTIERERVGRLIVDLRENGGGNMALNRPLVDGLVRCDRVNRPGGLFVITGRRTFSAAMNLCSALEHHTRALFVGEPTGTAPNHYGENGDLILPHSGLRATVSTLFWQTSFPYDDRPWIAPDIPAGLTFSDELAGRDPALDAIATFDPEPAGDSDPAERFLRRIGRMDLLG